ncbi:MAG: pre-16S rRNA-processing nuclease YqgF [Armatimonadetes bacterium]|nr:pre-16S rRNA-processing nuclease YqgF [Armatimonadota bacterium]
MEQSDQPAGPVLAVDPGRDKCGIAVLTADGRVLYRGVVSATQLAGQVSQLVKQYDVVRLLLGDRTAAKDVGRRLGQSDCPLEPVLVDEHRSSEEGRRRYFRDTPRRGWRRLLPIGLQTPPCAYDDYVAVILAERYLASQASR